MRSRVRPTAGSRPLGERHVVRLAPVIERRHFSRPRVSIQKGTGLYESYKARLQELAPSDDLSTIAARLSA